jgi:hypothetical protein
MTSFSSFGEIFDKVQLNYRQGKRLAHASLDATAERPHQCEIVFANSVQVQEWLRSRSDKSPLSRRANLRR